MQTCDVLIVGGGPAGAACAWKLRQAHADVLVVDRATFPRDKPCAGWVTPQAFEALAIDPDEYRRGRTLQPFTGFRIGMIEAERDVAVTYGHPISYGIRRVEFDHYLLFRSGARTVFGAPVADLRREGPDLIVNGEFRTRVIVGAGGSACPVAAWINGAKRDSPRSTVVLAQETEVALGSGAQAVAPEIPELFFSRDLAGYGWCIRKGSFLNVGCGHLAGLTLPRMTGAFVAYLERRGKVPRGQPWRWRGRAYRTGDRRLSRLAADGVLLTGDAAGLARAASGEGIRPAIESGLMAARVIVEAGGRYTGQELAPYEHRVRERFTSQPPAAVLAGLMPRRAVVALTRPLLGLPWFVRRIVLDRLFLRAADLPLSG